MTYENPIQITDNVPAASTPESNLIVAALDALIALKASPDAKGVYSGLYNATRGMIESACDRAYGTYNFRLEASQAAAYRGSWTVDVLTGDGSDCDADAYNA